MTKRALCALLVVLGCRKADPDATTESKPKKPALARCVVEKNGNDYTIAPRCDVSWTTKFELNAEETLTIGAGSRVRFSEQGEIASLGGKIVARGTADEPVVMTSSDQVFHLVLDEPKEGVAPTSIFEHVKIERGSLEARKLRARVQLADVSFHDGGTALMVAADEELVSAKRLKFTANKIDMFGPAGTFSRIEDTAFVAPIRLNGAYVKGAVTLPKAPAYIVDSITITEGSLTIPEGSTVQFNTLGSIEAKPLASLIAKKVVFTSGVASPKAGDWSALLLDGTSSKLDGCTIEYAGSSYSAAVRFATDSSKATIVNTSFRNNRGAGIEAPDCTAFDDPASGNKAVGGTVCTIAQPGLGLGLGLLGPGSMNEPGTIGILGSTALKASKVVETSSTISGKLPPEVVKRIVRANFPRLRACYDVGRKSDPTINGTVTVKFVIDSKGAVTSAIATPGTLKHAATTTCIGNVFKTLSFPEPEAGIVTVSMTHEFSVP